MVTEKSLTEKYILLSNADLLEILSNKEGYMPLAKRVALQEVKKRDISEEIIKNYQSVFSLKFDDLLRNWLVDLVIWEKVLLYIIWFPRWRSFITDNFYTQEYYLKARQANYYLVRGISFAILGAILDGWFSVNFFAVFIGGFLLIYVFDVFYNRQRQIYSLEKLKEKGRRPDGFEI